MSKPRVHDQATWRRSVKMRDQHGRQWAMTIDTRTMAPVGTPSWVDWTPPTLPNGNRLVPAQKYLRFDPEDLGNLIIDYAAWISDLDRADETWETQLQQFASGMYGEKAAEALDQPPPALLRMVGPRPFPVALAVACQAENEWALGTNRRARPNKTIQAVLEQMKPFRRREAEAVAASAADDSEDEETSDA